MDLPKKFERMTSGPIEELVDGSPVESFGNGIFRLCYWDCTNDVFIADGKKEIIKSNPLPILRTNDDFLDRVNLYLKKHKFYAEVDYQENCGFLGLLGPRLECVLYKERG